MRAALLLGLGYVLSPQWFAALLLYSPATAPTHIAMGVHHRPDVQTGDALGFLPAVMLGRGFGGASRLLVW